MISTEMYVTRYPRAMREKPSAPTADPQAAVEQLHKRRVALTRERDDAVVARDAFWAEIVPAIARGQDAPPKWDTVFARVEALDLQLEALELELADAEARAAAEDARLRAAGNEAEDREVAEQFPTLVEQQRAGANAFMATNEALVRFAQAHPRRIDRGWLPELTLPVGGAVREFLARVERVLVAVVSPPHGNGLVAVRRLSLEGRKFTARERRELAAAGVDLAPFSAARGDVFFVTDAQAAPLLKHRVVERMEPTAAPVTAPPTPTRPVRFLVWHRGFNVRELAWFPPAEIARLTAAGIATEDGVTISAPSAPPADELVPVVLLADGAATGNTRGDLAHFPRSKAEQLLAAGAARKPRSDELRVGRVDLERLEPPAAKPHPLAGIDWPRVPGGGPALTVRSQFGLWRTGEIIYIGPADVREALLELGWVEPKEE